MTNALFQGGPLDGKVVALLIEPPDELTMLAEEAWITEALAVVGLGDPDPERADYVLVARVGDSVIYVPKAEVKAAE